MTIEILRMLQILFACSCAPALWVFRHNYCALLAGRANRFDTVKSAVALMAFATALFPVRWLIRNDPVKMMNSGDLASWSGLYVLAIFAVQFLTWAVWELTPSKPHG